MLAQFVGVLHQEGKGDAQQHRPLPGQHDDGRNAREESGHHGIGDVRTASIDFAAILSRPPAYV